MQCVTAIDDSVRSFALYFTRRAACGELLVSSDTTGPEFSLPWLTDIYKPEWSR